MSLYNHFPLFSTALVAWKAVVDGVQEARAGYRLQQLPLSRMSGARVLGVLHDAVLFLLEQLQGAAQCYSHHFRFHQQEKAEEELPINPSGCARAEVYTRYELVNSYLYSETLRYLCIFFIRLIMGVFCNAFVDNKEYLFLLLQEKHI